MPRNTQRKYSQLLSIKSENESKALFRTFQFDIKRRCCIVGTVVFKNS